MRKREVIEPRDLDIWKLVLSKRQQTTMHKRYGKDV